MAAICWEVIGDRLTTWRLDDQAKKRAIREGKIKGVIKDNTAMFTDTVS